MNTEKTLKKAVEFIPAQEKVLAAGFGVAKVHRKYGDAVVEMLTKGSDSI